MACGWEEHIVDRLLQFGQAFVDDPSAPNIELGFPIQSEQMGIDATIKVPERFKEYREVSNADPEDVVRVTEMLKGVFD